MRYLCLYVGTLVMVECCFGVIFCQLPLYFMKIQKCFEQLNAPYLKADIIKHRLSKDRTTELTCQK